MADPAASPASATTGPGGSVAVELPQLPYPWRQPTLLGWLAQIPPVEAWPVTTWPEPTGLFVTEVTMTQPKVLICMSAPASLAMIVAVMGRLVVREAMLEPSPTRFFMTSTDRKS